MIPFKWVARRPHALVIGAVAVVVAGAAQASAASEVWWPYYGTNIQAVGTDGTGQRVAVAAARPMNLAVDVVHGKIYWINDGNPNRLRVHRADLDGTNVAVIDGGAPNFPIGSSSSTVAIDVSAGRLYWGEANGASSRIGYTNLDGTGGGILYTGLGAGVNSLTIDPARNRLYWTPSTPLHGFNVLNLDGTGNAGTVAGPSCGPGNYYPSSVNVDPAAGRVYLSNNNSPTVYRTALDGTGCIAAGNLGGLEGAVGLSVDVLQGRAYAVPNGIPSLGSAAMGYFDLESPFAFHGFTSVTDGSTDDSSNPVVVRAPQLAATATVSPASGTPGTTLTCSAAWAPDVPGLAVAQAPASQSVQWFRDGSAITGATAATYTASAEGSYTCRATASNAMGTSSFEAPAVRVATPAAPTAPSGPSGASVKAPPALPGAAPRCAGSTCVTTGTLPAGATSVRQSATTASGASSAARETARKTVRGTCKVTKPKRKKARSTYRCTIRLPKGRWAVTTTASGAGKVVAETTRTVTVKRSGR